MTFPLGQLPVELIEEVARHLDFESLCTLRLVCKTFREQSFHHFANTYLAAVQCTERRTGLERVKAISKHKTLSVKVRTLVIGAWQIGPDYFRHGRQAQSHDEWLVYCKIINELQYLDDGGFDVALLASSIAKLPYLDALYLTDDFRLEEREGGFEWTQNSYAEDPWEPTACGPWTVSHQFVPLLTALAAAGRKIRAFHGDWYSPLDQSALDFPVAQLSLLQPVLANIRSFKFWLRDNMEGDPDPSGGGWLRSLLSAMPSLEELGLAAHTDEERRPSTNFLQQVSLVKFPRLESLELLGMWCNADELQKILDNQEHTLTSLQLSEIHLDRTRDRHWTTILESLKHHRVLNRFYIELAYENEEPISFNDPNQEPQLVEEIVWLPKEYDACKDEYSWPEPPTKTVKVPRMPSWSVPHEFVGDAIRPGLADLIRHFRLAFPAENGWAWH